MPKWTVTYRRGRAMRTVRLKAGTAAEARELASARGTVSRVERSEGAFGSMRGRVLAMSRGERGTFLVRMSGMLRNRVTQLDAARQMASSFGGSIGKASRRAVDNMTVGMTLVEAMEADRFNFPPATVALMRAVARKGDTAQALREVATFEEDIGKVGRGNMSFIAKAVFGMAFGFGTMAYSTFVWTPEVLDNGIIKGKGYDFGWLITLGDWSLVGMGLIVGLVLLVSMASTVGRFVSPVASDRLVNMIPLYRDMVNARLNHLSLFRLSVLIGSGMMYKEALETSIEETRPGIMRRDLGRALANLDGSVSRRPWTHEITALHPTDRASLAMASSRADASRTLLILAEQYAELYRRRVGVIGPTIAMIGVGFVVYAGIACFVQTMYPMMELLRDMSAK